LLTDVVQGKIKVGTANKKIMHLRKIFEVVRENLYSELDNPFSVQALENDGIDKRVPFTEQDIDKIDKMLAESDVNDELKAMMLVSKNTGCGPKELALLASSDIVLNVAIPFIRISSNEFRNKVKGGGSRHREIPLVGEALEWIKRFPTGFPRYQKDNGGEAASAAANKFLKRHTGKTFYSFRHRLADLLRNTKCDQRVQNAIFGHASKNKMEDYYGSDIVMAIKYDALAKGLKEGPNLMKLDQEKDNRCEITREK
jgi:integrase